MKKLKKWLKNGLALALAGSMIFSLAACGGKSGNADETGETAKEFYYVPSYQDLDLTFDYIERSLSEGDILYLMGSSWNETTGESSISLCRYNLLTSEKEVFPLDLGQNSSIQGMVLLSDGNLAAVVNQYIYEYEDTDGGEAESPETSEAAADEAEAAETGETAADKSEPAEASETNADAAESAESEEAAADTAESAEAGDGASSGTVTITAEGSTTAVDAESDITYTEPVNSENSMELLEISGTDGSILSRTDIKPILEDPDNFWTQYMVADGEDNIYISDGNSTIYVMDRTGNKLADLSVENWVQALFASKEGTVYLQSYGNTGDEIRPVDLKQKKLGEPLTGEGLSAGAYSYNNQFYKGTDTSLLVSNSSNVYTYDIESDTRTELFSWLDVDINSDNVSYAGQLSDGRFYAVLQEYTEGNQDISLVYIVKTPASEVTVKEELTLGTMYLDQSVRKNIIDFNKTNETYHITVKEYYSEDYESGRTQFNNDITSGSGPDIIDISNLDYKQYAAKGVFEDLYPYMEKDGINREDYLTNIFSAFESDGKLYAIIPQFYISTFAAKSSLVGDEPGWTLSEMLDFVEKNDPKNIFQYGSRSSIFYYCIYSNIDEFINWETGECSFNGEDFIRILNFANQFPEETDYSEQEEGTSAMLRSNKVLLMQTTVSSVQEYQMMCGLFGEKITFIGYPSSDSKGNMIQPVSGTLAINARSKHKDGAWEFVKTLLSDDYQDSLVNGYGNWGFPVKKSALEKQFEADMTPDYYTDENGKQVESSKTTWGYDDFQMDIYAATEEEVEAVREIISSAVNLGNGSTNDEIVNIITEETEAFFKGQKTAQDVADIIQNRAQIYVNENS